MSRVEEALRSFNLSKSCLFAVHAGLMDRNVVATCLRLAVRNPQEVFGILKAARRTGETANCQERQQTVKRDSKLKGNSSPWSLQREALVLRQQSLDAWRDQAEVTAGTETHRDT